MAAKFQIVRTLSGYHLRLLGSNGESVSITENYPDRETAYEAIVVTVKAVEALITGNGFPNSSMVTTSALKEAGDTDSVEEVDERPAAKQ